MRADIYLTQYGYAPSRSRAAGMIAQGSVTLDGALVTKASAAVDETIPHTVVLTDLLPYVGRGGWKLEKALDTFAVGCEGKIALDIGASTGGFTDCMLRRGAAHVIAVDAGSGQLAPSLMSDERVTNVENCNARYLRPERLGPYFPSQGVLLAAMDVSFISQTLILPALYDLLAEGADLITLIKPQFEVGRGHIGKRGIVHAAQAHRDAILRVLNCATTLMLFPQALCISPIQGGDGNTEYLLHLKKKGAVAVTCNALLGAVGL